MDIVVIGKRSFNRNDKPEVIYCGQSWEEARAAVNAAPRSVVNFYQVNAEPYRPLRPEPVAVEATPEVAAPDAEPIANGAPKKSKK